MKGLDKIAIIVCFQLLVIPVFSQINHQNSDSGATVGSKIKIRTGKFTARFDSVRILPDSLVECSGVIFWNNLLWMHNDGGNKPVLFGLDEKARIKTKIHPAKINNDWEDIAQDSNHIYIGNFGNNSGSRKNLNILKINKNKILKGTDSTINSELISFSYPDQYSFQQATCKTNFDCEAFFVWNDTIYLFSKNWLDEKTRLYRLPASEGKYTAELYDSFDSDGLVTGADISTDGLLVALSGYKNYSPFIWLLSGFKNDHFFSGSKVRFDFTSDFGSQTEGICFFKNHTLLITSEKSPLHKQKIFWFDISRWLEN